jgi:signal transduction histidine kinase
MPIAAMRSLAVKLTLLFLAVSVAGTMLASLLIRRQAERQFDQLIRQQGEAYFVRDVQAYYLATGSLYGIDRLLYARYTRPEHGQPPRSMPFALAGPHGEILVPAGSWQRGHAVPVAELAAGLPVTVGTETVATVLLLNLEPARDSFEEEYLRDFNQALLLGALGATAIAIVLGGVLANQLTQPLREVAAASEALAAGELGQQVPVRTRDELGQLASSFNQMSAALARATQQRQQMTADIAHDLRTPLSVIGGYLEAMEEGTLPPTPGRLAILQQEVNGLQRLVDDLRTLSLADAGELPLAPQETDVRGLLEQVSAAYAPQAERQEVELLVDAPPDLPPVWLDPERMRQVLGNLLSNALRYTASGEQITLAARQHGSGQMGQLLLTIADTGAGIAPEDLPYVFDRFYRSDKARAEGHGESGLGLAIVRSLVAMHQGTITVRSAPGEGTTFSMRLPL